MSRVRFPTFHLHIDFARHPHPPPSYFSFIVGRPRLRNAPARERERVVVSGKLHYFDLYFIYYLAASYAMTYRTNFNSLSDSGISREILDLREKKLESMEILFSIAKRFMIDRLEKRDVA